MSLTRKLILRSMRARPARMLLSMFGIVLGVATILAIGITNQAALDSVTRLFESSSGKANLVVLSAQSDGEGFRQDILSKVDTIPGVEAAVPIVQAATLLADDVSPSELGINFMGTSTQGLILYGIDQARDLKARDYTIVDGEFLSADEDAYEVVLVQDYAVENEIQTGDTIEIIAASGIEKLKVVGLMAKEGPGQLNNGAFGVMPLQAAQKIFYRQDMLDQIDLVVTQENRSSAQLEETREQIQATLGNDYSVVYPASQGKRMTQMLGNYQIGLNFLSGMALFVGAFLIYNAFSMTIVERTREFAMLRTIGLTRSQVMRQVLSEALLLGTIGAVLGVALGVLMARGLSQLMGILLNAQVSAAQIPWSLVVTGLLVGIAVAVLAATLPAMQAGRISPLEALRMRAATRESWWIRRGWTVGLLLLLVSTIILVINPFPYDVQFRLGSMVVAFLFIGGTLVIPASFNPWQHLLRPLIKLIFGRSGVLGSSNLRRSRLRTTLTVAALMIGVSMIVVVWAMTDSFKGDLDEWLEGYMGGDLYVTSTLSMGNDVWRRLESVEGIAAAAPVRYFDVEWKTPTGQAESITFMAIDPASYNQVTSFVFSQSEISPQQALSQLAAGETVFISSVLAEKYALEVGDSIILRTKTGERSFKIAAVVVDYYNQGLVVSGSWLDMGRYFRQKDANTFLVRVEDGYTPNEVKQRVDALYGKRDRLTIITNQTLLEDVSLLMDQAFSMFDVLAMIAMLVGFFGITNTLTMNVMERTQEIGMLRGVGMTRSQVLVMILAEAALMGFIGGILGVIFGAILARIFMLAMTAMSGYRLAYILPVTRILFALLAAIGVALLAAFLPALRAARTHVLEAIHYE